MGSRAPDLSAPNHHHHQYCDEAGSEVSSITDHCGLVPSGQPPTEQQQPKSLETSQDKTHPSERIDTHQRPPVPTEVLLPREKMAVMGVSLTNYYEDGTMEGSSTYYYDHKIPYFTPHWFIHGVLFPPWIRRSPGWLQCLVVGCLFLFLAAALIIFASVAWQMHSGEDASFPSGEQQQEKQQAWRNNNVIVSPTPPPSSLLQLPVEVTIIPTASPSVDTSHEPSPWPSEIPSPAHSDTSSKAPSPLSSEQPTASFTDTPSVSIQPSQSSEPVPSLSDMPSHSFAPSRIHSSESTTSTIIPINTDLYSSGIPSAEPTLGSSDTTFVGQRKTSFPSMLPSLPPSLPPFHVNPSTATPTNVPTNSPSFNQGVGAMMGGGGMGMKDTPRLTAFPTFSPRGVNTQ